MLKYWDLKPGDIIWQKLPREEREYSQSAYMLYEANKVFNTLPKGVAPDDLYFIEQVEGKEVKVSLYSLRFSHWEIEEQKMVDLSGSL